MRKSTEQLRLHEVIRLPFDGEPKRIAPLPGPHRQRIVFALRQRPNAIEQAALTFDLRSERRDFVGSPRLASGLFFGDQLAMPLLGLGEFRQ